MMATIEVRMRCMIAAGFSAAKGKPGGGRAGSSISLTAAGGHWRKLMGHLVVFALGVMAEMSNE
jgi:hypothetical protein